MKLHFTIVVSHMQENLEKKVLHYAPTNLRVIVKSSGIWILEILAPRCEECQRMEFGMCCLFTTGYQTALIKQVGCILEE